ncbi:MAG: hybrid sensor histidine kinase/response regulator [Phenylobacterium sp.]|uniref:ATP-binding response regulator n=1 Tax=Phenylobacterium sp. TaxID=1871053 RepID=UPI001A5A6D66|nr:hybrid sensor histidine kinase/response regulator [Phenylobacterium sp.]MBL8774267.1 hybrid sensor histidine kinase/response regulator [Phenylobacterium sp.]
MDPSSGPDDIARRDWIRAEQVRALYRGSPVGVTLGGVAAVTLAVFLARDGRMATDAAAIFCGLTVVLVAALHVLCAAFRRRQPPDAAWRPWAFAFTAVIALQGATWIPGAAWMTSPTDVAQTLVVLLVSGMVVLGALPVFSAYLPAYLALAIPVVTPQVVLGLSRTYPFHEVLSVLTLTFLVAAPALAVVLGRQFRSGLELRFDNMRLIEDLRLQRERADQANLAKSRFLAAASHDLRQPAHALGLFAGALAELRLSPPARRLADHITGSVRALDTLFAVLLDVSKLDAGVVEARREVLRLDPLLARLVTDYAEQAAAKGVALRRARTSLVVVSDPVLLEQVLRNLISNAVKYTDAGGVVVGARRRGGRAAVEVWDTGRGVAPDQAEAIFEEFYQVDNPERDRDKGLGLGLAIVRRITPLIGADLDFASAPGRGSVFRLLLPRGAPEDLPAPVAAAPAAGALRTGFIVVVDDEDAIRRAMAALLARWGHRVLTAGSTDEALAHLGRGDGQGVPDLIICDDRLRGGETGAGALRRLRAACGADTPALLVTGDATAAGGEGSADLVLHKPVPHAVLRAAIGQLMRDRPA